MKGLDQPDAIRAVQNTADHHRRRAEVARIGEVWDFRTEARVDPRPPPRHAKPRDVVLVDLIERRVLGGSGIGTVSSPFAALRSLLSGSERRSQDDRHADQSPSESHHRSLLMPARRLS
jgi:hypothetical protein